MGVADRLATFGDRVLRSPQSGVSNMKRILLAAMTSGLALAAATPANAAIIFGVGFNGGAVTQVSNDGGTGSGNYNTTTGGYFYNSSATGFPLLLQPNLLTQSVNIQQASATGGTLNLYITQTDLAAFTGLLTSTFTSNSASNATAVLRSYFSATNELFGGTQLASATLNSPTAVSFANALTAVGPFSQTVRYDITFGPGTGNFNGTANLTATAVPEPATWAMMLFGFGGFGYAMRRGKKVGTRIRFA